MFTTDLRMLNNLSIEKIKDTRGHNTLERWFFSITTKTVYHWILQLHLKRYFLVIQRDSSFCGPLQQLEQESKTKEAPAVNDEEALILPYGQMDKCCASWLELCDAWDIWYFPSSTCAWLRLFRKYDLEECWRCLKSEVFFFWQANGSALFGALCLLDFVRWHGPCANSIIATQCATLWGIWRCWES